LFYLYSIIAHTQKKTFLKKIIIAIDGHSSCGKSTLANELAETLGYVYISSGKMYRAVTLYFIENKIDYKNQDIVDQALSLIHIHFEKTEGNDTTFLNGKNVESDIISMPVAQLVSPVSAIPAVRRAMVAQQQQMGINKGIVMDGRDIGTVVFKEAALKVFLTASERVRAQRRYDELLSKGKPVDLETIRQNLANRDHIDSTRRDSPLRQAEDAVLLDNSNLSREEQLGMIKALVDLRTR